VKLSANGKSWSTTGEVILDPRLRKMDEVRVASNNPAAPGDGLSLTGLDKQLPMALQVRDDITRLSETVNSMKALAKQLKDRNELLKDDPKAAELIKSSKSLQEKLDALEGKMHNPKAEVPYDILAQKGGAQLYSKIVLVYSALLDGDGPPTLGMLDEYADQLKEMKQYLEEWKNLMAKDLVKLNEDAKKLDYPIVIVPVVKNP
jgi:cell fate (sporulation/competence/biofilm development) regulator YlbF (YheA/YmcA/DUF963 family)